MRRRRTVGRVRRRRAVGRVRRRRASEEEEGDLVVPSACSVDIFSRARVVEAEGCFCRTMLRRMSINSSSRVSFRNGLNSSAHFLFCNGCCVIAWNLPS